MIVVYGDTKCLFLEENALRFLDAMNWCSQHKCLLKKKKVILRIKKCGVVVVEDEDLNMEVELCDVYNFHCECRTCGKKKNFVYED